MFRSHAIFTKQLGEGEEFDVGCMCISVFGESERRFIVVGSYAGILRIFNIPASYADAKAEVNRGDTALFEDRLSAPILQVGSGHFVKSHERMCLAVLQPRKLIIFDVNFDNGDIIYDDYGVKKISVTTRVALEQNLKRTAINMVCGSSGTGSRREFICVQSTDCTLTVFEQESLVFTVFLPSCLLPSRFLYFRSVDAFVISHGDVFRCFRYQSLAASQHHEDAAVVSSTPKAEWTFVTGERTIDMVLCDPQFAIGPQSLICISDQSVFCISDSGRLRFMLKLGYEPSAIHAYNAPRPLPLDSRTNGASENADNFSVKYVIGTRSYMLRVYENATAMWACNLDYMPVQIAVTNIGSLYGVLLLLGESGVLSLAYLGTEPSIYVPGASSRSPYLSASQQAKMQDELRAMQKFVRDATSGQSAQDLPRPSDSEELALQLSIIMQDARRPSNNNQSDYAAFEDIGASTSARQRVPLSATLSVSLRSRVATLEELCVDAKCRLPIVAVRTGACYFRTYDTRSALAYSSDAMTFRLEQMQVQVQTPKQSEQGPDSDSDSASGSGSEACLFVPVDLRVIVSCTYNSAITIAGSQPATRLTTAHGRVPLALVASACAAQKDAEHKVTFSVEQHEDANVNLADLFRDLHDVASQPAVQAVQGGSMIGLRLGRIEQVVSVLATRNKFRVQSDRADLLYLPLKTLLDRLQASITSAGNTAVIRGGFSLHGRFPIEMLVNQVGVTFIARQRMMDVRKQLNVQAAFYRDVQKQAFLKFREPATDIVEMSDDFASTATASAPKDSSIISTESLLDDVYAELMRLIDELSRVVWQYRAALNSLESTLRLLALCAQLALGLSPAELRALECVLLIEHIVAIIQEPLTVAELASKADDAAATASETPPTFDSGSASCIPGWEELESAVLKLILRQESKFGSMRADFGSLGMPESTQKLCQLLEIFFDKLLKRSLNLSHLSAHLSDVPLQSGTSSGQTNAAANRLASRNADLSNDAQEKSGRSDTIRKILKDGGSNETGAQEPSRFAPEAFTSSEMDSRRLPTSLSSKSLKKLQKRSNKEDQANEVAATDNQDDW